MRNIHYLAEFLGKPGIYLIKTEYYVIEQSNADR